MFNENKKGSIDEELFEKIASGDDEAFSTLYYSSYKQLYGFLISLTKNKEDAEDLLQNTYIKIRNGSHLYKKQGTPMGWMCKIAKNLYLDHVRKYGKYKKVDFELVDNYISQDNDTSSEQKILIEQALKGLKDEEKTIVVMYIYMGLKHREIAEIIGSPLSTVLSKYNRALKKMKKILER